MKTKIFILLTVVVMLTNHAYGQSSSDTYVLGKSIDMKLNCTGFLKSVDVSDDFYVTAPITFSLASKEKGFNIFLFHFNTARQPRKIVTMEVSKLGSLNAIDAADFILNKTKEEAIEWAKARIDKRIWVIDKNDFYWEGAKQYMKLIETTIESMMYPEPPIERIERM